MFLHGLAGSGREWEALQEQVPAEAPDLRAAGTRNEYVSDVVDIIGNRRMSLIGHSLGGHTAFLVAARYPDLVDRLVVIEAGAALDAQAPERIRALLTEHRAPYGVELDPENGARAVAETATRDWWDEWTRIRCPVLVVRGQHGLLDQAVADRMAVEVAWGRVVEIEGAGHDVHLDSPIDLGAAIRRFLTSV